jgi:hypothetical protein
MIEKRIQTLVDFRVICDGCQRAAPKSPVKEEALTQAMEAGFQTITRWSGLEHVTTHLCPDCQQEWAEGPQTIEEWEAAERVAAIHG